MLRIYVKVPPAPVEVVVVDPVKYGLLYNWYAATDARLICADGWKVPEKTDGDSLLSYLGSFSIAGGKLKDTDTTYWDTPNTGATNEVGFNAKGSAIRTHTSGVFSNLKTAMYTWGKDNIDLSNGWMLIMLSYANSTFGRGNTIKTVGSSIRLIKTTTSLTHGQTGTYTGNDGKVYRTICIGTQEWLADNLAETKYRNGDTIPEVTDNSAWAALTTGALCAYNNDWSNV